MLEGGRDEATGSNFQALDLCRKPLQRNGLRLVFGATCLPIIYTLTVIEK